MQRSIIVDALHVFTRGFARAPEDGADAGFEFVKAAWLGQIVIGAKREAFDDVIPACFGGGAQSAGLCGARLVASVADG